MHLSDETGAQRQVHMLSEFASQEREAWLDIWAFGGVQIQDLLIDVTIRHPAAEAYQPRAAQQPGHAASSAEQQKLERYPERDGRSIVPFAVETWGRMGGRAEDLLQKLAAEAARHHCRRGQSTTAGTFMKRWRASLDATLQRGQAMSLIAARVGLAGRAHQQRTPAS